MKTDKNKSKEPFPPENTPVPPQVMNPNEDSKQDIKNSGQQHTNKPKADQSASHAKDEKKDKKLLEESDTEIDDETTT